MIERLPDSVFPELLPRHLLGRELASALVVFVNLLDNSAHDVLSAVDSFLS